MAKESVKRPRKPKPPVVFSTEPPETEQRVILHAPLFERPGTSQPKRHRPRVRAREQRLGGRSLRNEKARQDADAEEKLRRPNMGSTKWHQMTMAEQLAMLDEAAREAEAVKVRKKAAGTHKEGMRIVDGRPAVWTLGSWVEGEPRCPDERLNWEG
jgi:hypothetical protein